MAFLAEPIELFGVSFHSFPFTDHFFRLRGLVSYELQRKVEIEHGRAVGEPPRQVPQFSLGHRSEPTSGCVLSLSLKRLISRRAVWSPSMSDLCSRSRFLTAASTFSTDRSAFSANLAPRVEIS